MKTRLRAVVMAALLSLTLAALIAPVASAAPKVVGPPKIPDCSSWQTVANSSGTSWSGNSSVSVYLQREWPGYCTGYRAVGNLHTPDGCKSVRLHVQYLTGSTWNYIYDDGFSYCYGDAGSGGWDIEMGTIIPAYLRANIELWDYNQTTYYTSAYSYSTFQS